MSRPLVTVGIPVWNRPQMLHDCLSSVISQTYEPMEIVVVDNHSDDETAHVARELARSDDRVHVYVNELNIGTANYSKLLHYSRGDFVLMLNSDDMLEPGCIERMVEALDQPGVTMAFCRPKCVDIDLRPIDTPPHLKVLDRLLHLEGDQIIDGRELGSMMLAVTNSLVGYPSQVMWRRSSLGDSVSLVLDGLIVKAGGDVAHWLIMLGRGDAAFIDEALTVVREHGGQESNHPHNLINAAFDYLEIAESAAERGFLIRTDDRCSATAVVLRQLAWRLNSDDAESALRILKGIRVANARLRANMGGPAGLRANYHLTTAFFVERGDGSETRQVAERWLEAFGDRLDVSLMILAPTDRFGNVLAELWPLRQDAKQPLAITLVDNIPSTGALFLPGPNLLLGPHVTVEELKLAIPENRESTNPWPEIIHHSAQWTDRMRTLKSTAVQMGIEVTFPELP